VRNQLNKEKEKENSEGMYGPAEFCPDCERESNRFLLTGDSLKSI